MIREKGTVVVVGAGKTGISTANFLKKRGFNVILNDLKKMEKPKALDEEIEFISGEYEKKIFEKADFIILSPGINKKNFPIKNKKIIGDIELFYFYNKSKIIGITGTNGKSTTTILTGEILKRKYKIFVGGNIGIPVMDAFNNDHSGYEFSVLELSSFQLELIEKFCPEIAVVLNITPDHLNRYSNFDEYVNAKLNIFKNQTKNQIAILNYNDKILRKLKLKSKIYYFSLTEILDEGAFLKDNKIIFRIKNQSYEIDIKDIKLNGVHFYEDIMAAGIISILTNVEWHYIEEVLRNFKELPHRMEFLGEFNGVKFYNDSKSTTVDSTFKALKSFKDNKVVLLLGGVHKGESYKKIGENKNLKKIICYGEARDLIFEDLKNLDITKVDNFYNAVKKSLEIADKGDIVLLSPACSSFDEFENFEQRGELFRRLIKNNA